MLATRPVGPLAMKASFMDASANGVVFTCVGDGPAPLLEWQSEHGFSGVPETSLKKLASHFGLDLEKGYSKESLLLSLILHINDGLERGRAVEILHRSSLCDEPPQHALGDLTDELVYDFALAGEQQEVCSMLKQFCANKDRLSRERDRIAKAVEKTFGKAKEAVKRAKSKVALAKERHRFRGHLAADAPKGVRENAPPNSHVHVDQGNGCFRVSVGGGAIKSFSWFKRGMEAAAILTLRHMWAEHTAATGVAMPEHLDIYPADA